MKPEETFDLLGDLVEEIDLSFVGTSAIELTAAASPEPGIYKIFTEDTKWLTKGYTITTNALDYLITDFLFNEYIIVSGTSIPTDLEFNIYAPKLSHGTVLEQNELLNLLMRINASSVDRLPLIWLKERVRERFEPDELLRLDRESDCDIYFLIDCNMEDWLRVDFDKYTIKPMRNLVAAFIEVLGNSPNVGIDFRYEVSDDARFGLYQDDKGVVKQIFADALSGCYLKITIPFLKANC